MNRSWIVAAKSAVVAVVAGTALWTVGGAAVQTLGAGDASHSTSTVADPINWSVVTPGATTPAPAPTATPAG